MSLAVDLYQRRGRDGAWEHAATVTHESHDERLRYLDHLRNLWALDLGYTVEWHHPSVMAARTRTGIVTKLTMARAGDTPPLRVNDVPDLVLLLEALHEAPPEAEDLADVDEYEWGDDG